MENKQKINKLSNDVETLNIIASFGKGEITLEQCYALLKERKREMKINDPKAENLDTILRDKLEKEYKKLCNSLKSKTPDEIISKAYELTVKKELKDEITTLSWYDREKAIMIDQDNLLDEFYHDWLDTEIALGDVLIDSLEDSVSMITRYYGKQNKFRVAGRRKDNEYDR